jgi:hypothetical protein
MPSFRKLEPDEVKTYENKGKGTRKLTEELYDSILADYEIGDYGEATLDDGENRLTVRNRLKAAATRRGLGINFRRTTGDLIHFQVTEASKGEGTPDGVTPAPEILESAPIASSAPPKRKGGRPKKETGAATSSYKQDIFDKVTRATSAALTEVVLGKPGRPKKILK